MSEPDTIVDRPSFRWWQAKRAAAEVWRYIRWPLAVWAVGYWLARGARDGWEDGVTNE